MRTSPRRIPSARLRVEALEAREVPAAVGRPFWFLSSGWDPRYAGRIGAPPPAPTPTPTVPRPATPTLVLAAASDTGTAGDRITTLPSVTLTGTTSPNATVRLVQTGATATADATGAFSFTGVALDAGANTLTVQARNAAGRTSSFTTTITRTAAPTVAAAPGPVTVGVGASTTVDLAGTFDDADITNTRVRFNTSGGPVNVELFDRQAPKTVANFLNYVADGDYTDAIFHRSVSSFVLQGGGFTFEAGPPVTLAEVPTDPPVQNEPDPANRSNLRGTVAMAKLGGDPNSATSQFFFNLGNNSANLDNQNGGFTVFGKVVGAADQAVVDDLAALPTQNRGGAFTNIPLTGYNGTTFPAGTARANYAIINGVSVVSQPEALTYSVAGNTAPTVATATVTKNRLTIQGVQAGTTTITVRATDKSGATVETPVTVTVS